MATDDPCSVVEDILLNLTSEDNGTMTSEFPLYIRVNVTVICVMILIVGVLGNLLVVIVVWKNQDMRNSTNYLLVNLSIADMLVLIVCLPTILVDINSQPEVWNMGQVMCK